MSSILTALKKLEHEKILRKQDPSGGGIRIIQGAPPSRKGFPLGTYLAVIALFILGVWGTYVFTKHQEVTTSAQLAKTIKNEVRGEALTVRPASQVSKTEPPPGPSVKAISAPVTSMSVTRTMVNKQPDQRLKSAKIVPKATTVVPISETTIVPPTPKVMPVRSVFKINGIAFQDGAEKVAVVNGITVTNGSMIDGTKVEEIQKDRVKFNRGGERFEIMWDKSN